jgi:hypothetical protein
MGGFDGLIGSTLVFFYPNKVENGATRDSVIVGRTET